MLDHDYISELRELEDKKEAKAKLIDYAKESFNLDVKKSKGFDSIIADIEQHIKDYEAEAGLVENEEGSFSPSDFVDEANKEQMQGEEVTLGILQDAADVFIETTPKTVELAIGSPVEPVGELPEGVVSYVGKDHEDPAKLEKLAEAVKEAEKPGEMYDIGDFVPTVMIIGKGTGYAHCPWWIYEWIRDNPDWKQNPKKFMHPTAHPTLFSFIYYIKRDGFIRVRETKNSSFHILD